MTLRVRVSPESDAGIRDAPGVVERAARAAAADRGAEEGELSLTLLGDDRMAELNREWLQREGPTDVLAFALHDEGEPVIGDVYIGVDRAVAQAADEDEPPRRELARLAVHGTLHVLGYDHPETGREESEMWRHQERIVAGLELP
ncbi:MAG: rRNA maturation RNase YbeY [Longimicrobiales bacterium]|nr:rRNA maturation RNase YbeY [Longimicrobiales bacterium]